MGKLDSCAWFLFRVTGDTLKPVRVLNLAASERRSLSVKPTESIAASKSTFTWATIGSKMFARSTRSLKEKDVVDFLSTLKNVFHTSCKVREELLSNSKTARWT